MVYSHSPICIYEYRLLYYICSTWLIRVSAVISYDIIIVIIIEWKDLSYRSGIVLFFGPQRASHMSASLLYLRIHNVHLGRYLPNSLAPASVPYMELMRCKSLSLNWKLKRKQKAQLFPYETSSSKCKARFDNNAIIIKNITQLPSTLYSMLGNLANSLYTRYDPA